MKKVLLPVLVVIFLLSACDKVTTPPVDTGSGFFWSPTPAILNGNVDIMGLPQGERATAIEAKIKDVPKEWGTVVSWERATGENKEPLAFYSITYTGKVWGIYQPGVEKLYFVRQVQTGDCGALQEKYKEDPNVSTYDGEFAQQCGLFESGIYDSVSHDSVLIKKRRFISPMDFAMYGTPLDQSAASMDSSGTEKKFSPSGKYILLGANPYEGCGLTLTSTEDGTLWMAGEDPVTFSCDPQLTFSKDEGAVAIQANWSGMASPHTEFTLISRGSSFPILPLLYKDAGVKTEDLEDEPDVLASIRVTSLDDSALRFTVNAKSKDLTPGSFEYVFATKKLNRIK